jgi:hypothetical protein
VGSRECVLVIAPKIHIARPYHAIKTRRIIHSRSKVNSRNKRVRRYCVYRTRVHEASRRFPLARQRKNFRARPSPVPRSSKPSDTQSTGRELSEEPKATSKPTGRRGTVKGASGNGGIGLGPKQIQIARWANDSTRDQCRAGRELQPGSGKVQGDPLGQTLVIWKSPVSRGHKSAIPSHYGIPRSSCVLKSVVKFIGICDCDFHICLQCRAITRHDYQSCRTIPCPPRPPPSHSCRAMPCLDWPVTPVRAATFLPRQSGRTFLPTIPTSPILPCLDIRACPTLPLHSCRALTRLPQRTAASHLSTPCLSCRAMPVPAIP